MRKHLLCALLCALLLLSCALAEENVLDLSGSQSMTLQSVSAKIAEAGDVTEVNLTGVDMPLSDRKALLKKYPDIHFRWKLDVFGAKVSSEDTTLDLYGHHVGSISKLMDYLDCLPGLEKVLMYNNYATIAEKEQLFYGYPHIFFGFRIPLQNLYDIRTETVSFSTLKNGSPPYVRSEQLWWVKMCPNLKALDLGHNSIKSLDWLTDAPKLKVLILACNSISDLTPLASQTELEYLELFINDITDISPLANLKQLKDLNLSFNSISDVTPLYDLPSLERLWLTMNENIPQEQIDKLYELYPDAEIVLRSNGATGDIITDEGNLPGWRTHPRYFTIYEIFNYGGFYDWDDELPVHK